MSDVDLAKVSLTFGSILLASVVLPMLYKVVSGGFRLSKDDNYDLIGAFMWTYALLFIIAISDKSIVHLVNAYDTAQTYKIYDRLDEFWSATASSTTNEDLKDVYETIESVRKSFLLLNAIAVGILFFGSAISGYMVQRNKNRNQMENDYIMQVVMTLITIFVAFFLYYAYGVIGQMATASPSDFAVLSANWYAEAFGVGAFQ